MKQNKEQNTTTITITMQVPQGEYCIASSGHSCSQKRGITCLAFDTDLSWDNNYNAVKKCLTCLTLSGGLIQKKLATTKKQGARQ